MMGKKRKGKKGRKKKGRKKKGAVNKQKERKGEVRGEKIEERKKKEKRVGIKYLNKRKYCIGTEFSALLYIGILVTSTTIGHGGLVVSALASQAKSRGSIPSRGTSFFSHKYFLSSLSNICRVSN